VNLVLDTNVVIDWLVFDAPFLSAFRDQVRLGHVQVFTHQPAIDELRRVLAYRELKLDAASQAQVLERYQAQTSCLPSAEQVPRAPLELPKQFPRCRDPDDNHFLALAYHVKADALVSRDNAVLKLARRARKFGFQIMNVPQMVAAIR
jgi:putative PIN family toxin of toxin-antitoxin system